MYTEGASRGVQTLIRESDEALRREDSRARRLVLLSVLIALALGVAGAATAWRSYDSATADQNHRAAAGAAAGARDVSEFMRGRGEILDAIASSVLFQRADAPGIATRLARLDPAHLGLTRGVTWFDASGRVRATYDAGLTAGTDASGTLAQTLARSAAGADPVVAGPVQGSLYGAPVVVIAVPTHDGRGRVNGSLVGAVGIAALTRLAQARPDVVGDTLIVDQRGVLFVGPGLAAPRNAAAEPAVRAVRVRAQGARASVSGSLVGVRGPTGAGDRLVGFATDPAVTGWTVFSDRSSGTAYAAARRTLRAELGALALLVVLGLLGAAVPGRRLAGERRATVAAQGRTWRLQEMTAALAVAATPGDVARAVLEIGRGATSAAAGSVALLDRDGTGLTTLALVGYSDEIAGGFPSYPADATLPIPDSLRDGPLWLPDAAAVAARYPHLADLHASMSHEAVASLPLTVDGRSLGGLTLSFPDRRTFAGEERAFLLAIADLCAQALDRARLYEHERRDAERQHFLAEASVLLATRLEPRAGLAALARLAVPRMADWCTVSVVEDGVIERVAVSHADPAQAEAARDFGRHPPARLEDDGSVSRVMRSGHSEFVPVVTREMVETAFPPGTHRDTVLALGLASAITVPLVARGRTLGALSLASAHSGRSFDEEDLRFAEDLGARAGLAIDNALLTERARTIADALQQGLLPARLPAIAGLDVAARYVAGGEGVEVGGDFYDLFALDDDNGWVATLGDVCGKGLEAAALTALARHTIRAEADLLRPAAVLGRLNRAVMRNSDDMRFLTAAYAWLRRDGDDVTVVLARGGHPPALVLRADGTVENHLPPGQLIGIIEEPSFSEIELALSPGDTLILFSDGIVEARAPDGTFFGLERLEALLPALAGLPADGIASAVESAVVAFEGSEIHDDRALLLLRVLRAA